MKRMIYIADSEWNPILSNPFSADGSYGENWSSFLYDDSIPYFSNVYLDAKVYVLRFSPAADIGNLRFFDFLQYELSYGRNVIVRFCAGMNAQEILSRFCQAGNATSYRASDGEVLVHSTTLSAWEEIQRDGALLSPCMLRNRGQIIHEIGLKAMLEPKDYSDYVMLDIPNGCGELVVNSRNLGYVCTDPDMPYTLGIRLYFDVKKLFRTVLSSVMEYIRSKSKINCRLMAICLPRLVQMISLKIFSGHRPCSPKKRTNCFLAHIECEFCNYIYK